MQNRNLLALLLAASLLAACNLNVQLPASSSDQQAAATIVALTLQAAGAPLASPTAASVTPTPTYSKPMLSITGNSNCRTGPGASFKVVTAYSPGTDLELVGQDSANNYWQVKIPNSEETCWVWGQYATATGSFDTLPETAPSPAAASGAPARPTGGNFTADCPGGNLTAVVTWNDAADNETGYRVYRFDLLLADLPANTTSYTDVETITPPTPLQYSIEAYNDAGASARLVMNGSCG